MASCSFNPDIQVSKDACSSTLAVSGTGNAANADPDGTGCAAVAGCVAISATGSASNSGASSTTGCRGIAGCVAVSGRGDATNASGFSPSCGEFAGCVAASATGASTNASDTWQNEGASCYAVVAGCLSLSVTGPATNATGPSYTQCAAGVGCKAVTVAKLSGH